MIAAVPDEPLWDEADPLLADAAKTTAISPREPQAAPKPAEPTIAASNGQSGLKTPANVNGAVPAFQSIDEADRWMLAHPNDARALLQNYAAITGNPELAERTDLRFASIPTTRHIDPRRYGVGLAGVTSHMGELRAGELVAIGAREGHGKTSFAEKFALSNARDYKVLFATLEMTDQEIRDRILAKKLGYSLDRLEYEQAEGTSQYKAGLALVSSYDLLVWAPQKKEKRIESIVERAVDVSADLLLIDHARCLSGWRSGNAGGACDAIVEFMFDATRTTNITIVLLSQLNRDAAGRRPTNKNFQDTGFLEQKPDRCILLHRPFAGQNGKDDVCELIVSKNRKGPMFRAHTWWNGERMDYSSMDEYDENNAACCRKRKDRDED